MKQLNEPHTTFGETAPRLHANGYCPIPIRPKSKKGLEGWSTYKFEPRDAKRFPKHSVGLLTKGTPAVDIDVRRESLALKLEKLTIDRLGAAPVRIGQPPKRALMYRCVKPFKKCKTREFVFEDDPPGADPH